MKPSPKVVFGPPAFLREDPADNAEFKDANAVVAPEYRLGRWDLQALENVGAVGYWNFDTLSPRQVAEGLDRALSIDSRARTLAFFSAARAHYFAQPDRPPILSGAQFPGSSARPEARYLERSPALGQLSAGGLDSEVLWVLSEVRDHGELGVRDAAEGVTAEALFAFEKGLVPSQANKLEDALRRAWRVLELSPIRVNEVDVLGCFDPVREEIVVVDGKTERADVGIAIDNLRPEVQQLARKAAWLARHRPGAPRRKDDRDPRTVSMEDLRYASGHDLEASKPDEREAFLSTVAAALMPLLPQAEERECRAEVVLETPGEAPPVEIFSVPELEVSVSVSSQLSYEGRHSEAAQELVGVRTHQVRAELPEDCVLIVEPVGNRDAEAVRLEGAGPISLTAPGPYRLTFMRAGEVVAQTSATLPDPEPQYTDLSRFLGYDIRFPPGPAAVAEVPSGDDDEVRKTRLEVGTTEDASGPANHAAFLNPSPTHPPGRYRVELAGEHHLVLDAFPSGLVRARLEQAAGDVSPWIHLEGGGAAGGSRLAVDSVTGQGSANGKWSVSGFHDVDLRVDLNEWRVYVRTWDSDQPDRKTVKGLSLPEAPGSDGASSVSADHLWREDPEIVLGKVRALGVDPAQVRFDEGRIDERAGRTLRLAAQSVSPGFSRGVLHGTPFTSFAGRDGHARLRIQTNGTGTLEELVRANDAQVSGEAIEEVGAMDAVADDARGRLLRRLFEEMGIDPIATSVCSVVDPGGSSGPSRIAHRLIFRDGAGETQQVPAMVQPNGTGQLYCSISRATGQVPLVLEVDIPDRAEVPSAYGTLALLIDRGELRVVGPAEDVPLA